MSKTKKEKQKKILELEIEKKKLEIDILSSEKSKYRDNQSNRTELANINPGELQARNLDTMLFDYLQRKYNDKEQRAKMLPWEKKEYIQLRAKFENKKTKNNQIKKSK